jgi:hypothetical protein
VKPIVSACDRGTFRLGLKKPRDRRSERHEAAKGEGEIATKEFKKC